MTLPRPIRRLLIANRGEIAARLISAAQELSITPIALYTATDTTHARFAPEAVALASDAAYVDMDALLALCSAHNIDAVHPGYGFLSESAAFVERAASAGVLVVGPSAELLAGMADKVEARRVAGTCGVPVLPALEGVVRDVRDVKVFAERVGWPVMVKAVDGGGGRGIRLVRAPEELDAAFRRAVEESPSKSVFAEKAAVDGFLHVEVQVVGDGKGNIVHLLERQCSVQRRWQKVVEIAPCVSVDRSLVKRVIDAAVTMAKKVSYLSLGTFEFLVNPQTKEFYFLETNPRLQVEHTLTETILDIDLVKAQLLIAQGATLAGAGLPSSPNPLSPPTKFACQLRVTAEDVSKNWSLSIGKITSISLPGGNGVRVDQALTPGHVVGSSFDSLLAKIIVSGPTWDTVVRKAQRALNETAIEGVTTNLAALRGIVAHPDFAARDCDTTWLETHQVDLLRLGSQPPRLAQLPSASPSSSSSSSSSASSNVAAIASGPPLFRRGDAWTVTLTPIEDNKTDKPGTSAASSTTTTTHLSLSRIQRNHFPTELIGDVEVTTTSAATGSTTQQQYQLTLQATSSSASAVISQHRRGNAADPRHVVIPMPGKLVEVCVDEGDVLREGDVVCVVQQMKMEIEIRAKHAGRVVWVTEVEDGEEVSEGILAAEIELLEEKEVVATTTAAAKL